MDSVFSWDSVGIRVQDYTVSAENNSLNNGYKIHKICQL
jgi:hypothetical protein